jgi:hypothetical protein
MIKNHNLQQSVTHMNDIDDLPKIIAKLKDLKGLKTDREIGELLGYKGSGLHEAERTNRIPLKRLIRSNGFCSTVAPFTARTCRHPIIRVCP